MLYHFQPQTTNWRFLQTGDRRNARFLVNDDSEEEEEEDEKKNYFSDPESEESEDKSKWVREGFTKKGARLLDLSKLPPQIN